MGKPKLCVDCRFCIQQRDTLPLQKGEGPPPLYLCGHEANLNPVTGEIWHDCVTMRSMAGHQLLTQFERCGLEGRWFEAKAAVPAKATAL